MRLCAPLRFAFVGFLAALTGASCAVLPKTTKSTLTGAPRAEQMAELWVEPEGIPSRDLFHGPGGKEWMPAPGATFQFVEKDTTGWSWGWDVKDEKGVEWSVKYGPEMHSEIASSRLLWAIGFHQPPTYYVEHWSMTGGDEPGAKTPSRFRPSVPGRKRAGPWRWHRNPFVGTQPFRGLLVMMRLLNNWDLLERNNAVYDLDDPLEGARRWYVVLDLGASLGRTDIFPSSGSRSRPEDFEVQGFVKGVEDGTVKFDDLGRLHRELFRDIPPEDLRWTCERLDRLTPQQWSDAFRAAGYPEETAKRYIRKLQEKVAQGLALSK